MPFPWPCILSIIRYPLRYAFLQYKLDVSNSACWKSFGKYFWETVDLCKHFVKYRNTHAGDGHFKINEMSEFYRWHPRVDIPGNSKIQIMALCTLLCINEMGPIAKFKADSLNITALGHPTMYIICCWRKVLR